MVASHPDRDHFGGLTFVARNFHPRQFWTGGTSSDGGSYQELIAAMASAGARSSLCNSALATMIDGVTVRCLWPPPIINERKDNNDSVVLRIGYAGKAILFPGDLEAKGERELIASGAEIVAATILKVPHHGSITSSSTALLEAVSPRAAVMSLGYHNRFHFPSAIVVERYRADGITLLRTDQVELSSPASIAPAPSALTPSTTAQSSKFSSRTSVKA